MDPDDPDRTETPVRIEDRITLRELDELISLHDKLRSPPLWKSLLIGSAKPPAED